MGQLTIYVDDDAEKRIKVAARKAGVSVSRWIVDRVRVRAGREWSEDVHRLAGAWPDFPTVEEIRAGARDRPRPAL